MRQQVVEREMIAALLGARRALYAFLARCWDAPLDESALSLMRSFELEALCQMMDEGDAEGAGSLDDLRAKLVEEAALAGLDQAERAFNWCFIGIGTRVAPWESVYVSPDRLVFQASTLAVRDAYGAAGFVAKNKGSEPDDHIATECDFMAKLATRAMGAFDEQDKEGCQSALELSKAFLRDHLVAFIGDFADGFSRAISKAQEGDSGAAMCALGLYGTLAQFSSVFFVEDLALLEELLAVG